MTISSKKFLFNLSSANVTFPLSFKSNEDYKIQNIRTTMAVPQTIVDVTLDICKADYDAFLEYLYIDIAKTRYLFYVDLDFQGEYKEYLCDIISNISVNVQVNKYKISFRMIIIR